MSVSPLSSPWPVLKSYAGPRLARIALPLGGIGTGTVSLGGRGDLRDFEIVNRPAKGFTPPNAFFALEVQAEDGTQLAARCLEGPLDDALFEGSDGAQGRNHGLPRFADCRFDAAYPLASVFLSDPDVPVSVRLDAFNPLIPADLARSSYPVAVLRYIVRNPTSQPLSVSVCGCVPNFIGNDGTSTLATGNRNEWREEGGISGLFLTSDVPPDAETWGTMALVLPYALPSPPRPPSPAALGEGGVGGGGVLSEETLLGKPSKEIIRRARELRDQGTTAEQLLWDFVRDRRLEGVKFRRQHPIGRFIADFFSDAAKLIIELDGDIHNEPEQAERDALRADILRANRYFILRFTNEQVLNDTARVLESIRRHTTVSSPNTSPSPSEAGEGGQGGEGRSHRTAWARKSWNGGLLDFWDDFGADGELSERDGGDPVASLCQKQIVEAGKEAAFTFLLSWHFPNRQSWTPEPEGTGQWRDKGACKVGPPTIGNFYTTQFKDAWDAAQTVARDLPALEADTVAWVQAFCDSDLPLVVKEAALFNVSTLRTQTLFRLPDGNFYGWEGMHDRDGSCFGSCTHVWEKAVSVAVLFGDISRSMRETEFLAMTDTDTGLMAFRVGLPADKYARRWGLAAADGQMGCLMRLYLDWHLSGDDDWLRSLWPNARKALEFCWIAGGWDADKDGVMEGCQHNTMDVEYYGPNPQMGSAYLGALRACEEMARYLKETDFADTCRDLFLRGSAWMDAHLFNGDYYEHQIVPPTGAIAAGLRHHTMGATDPSDPELQLGAGCLIDQLGAQSTAHVCGLGHLLNPAQIGKTLESIVRFNFKENLRGHFNHLRTFALQDEAACLMATYPRGRRPAQPFPYYNEVMTGFEYIAAVGMLYEGQTANGLKLIEAIRARYDGRRRSPFNEAECGHHYARAMVSWSATLALTGFHYSAVTGTLTFDASPGSTFFWSNGSAWGTCQQAMDKNGIQATVSVGEGTLTIDQLTLTGCGRAEVPPRTLTGGETVTFHVVREGTG